MAAIDKTYYYSKKQYDDMYKRAKKLWLDDLVCDFRDDLSDEELKKQWWVFWNTSTMIDKYLRKKCPLKYIQDTLKFQYWSSYNFMNDWKLLVKFIDDWDSTAQPEEVVIDWDMYTLDYVDIVYKICDIKYIKWGLDFNQHIKIISITNLSYGV